VQIRTQAKVMVINCAVHKSLFCQSSQLIRLRHNEKQGSMIYFKNKSYCTKKQLKAPGFCKFEVSSEWALLSSFCMFQTCTYLHSNKHSPQWGQARNQ